MENKDFVLTTINNTKEEIKTFKSELINKGKELPDIKAITKSLSGIERIVNDIKKLCIEETKELELIFQNLSNAQIKELLNKKDVMFEVINDNLPNGMELRAIEVSNYDNIQKTKEIWFGDTKVGQIQILNEAEEEMYIEVAINDSIDRFEVTMPKRMYHIISFINTKFNYE